jgi:hypothetical protein
MQPLWISRKPVALPWQPGRRDLNVHPWTVTIRGASQSAVSRLWLSFCTVWPSQSQISSLSTTILAVGKSRSRRVLNLGSRGLTDLGDVMLCQKSLHENCRIDRRIVVTKLTCSLGHCECDGYTVHKLSQLRLTADWLAPRECDCSRMDNKISSDWLPSYMKATRPVFEIFKMAGYLPGNPRLWYAVKRWII